MDNIIDNEVGKFQLMKILKRHCKIDMLLTLSFNSKKVVTQGYYTEEVQMLADTIIPVSSF